MRRLLTVPAQLSNRREGDSGETTAFERLQVAAFRDSARDCVDDCRCVVGTAADADPDLSDALRRKRGASVDRGIIAGPEGDFVFAVIHLFLS